MLYWNNEYKRLDRVLRALRDRVGQRRKRLRLIDRLLTTAGDASYQDDHPRVAVNAISEEWRDDVRADQLMLANVRIYGAQARAGRRRQAQAAQERIMALVSQFGIPDILLESLIEYLVVSDEVPAEYAYELANRLADHRDLHAGLSFDEYAAFRTRALMQSGVRVIPLVMRLRARNVKLRARDEKTLHIQRAS